MRFKIPRPSGTPATSTARPMRHTTSPPTTVPTVVPRVMRETTLRAVCGSKRSLTSDQNADATVAPKSAVCPYTASAMARGNAPLRPHSIEKSAALSPNTKGTPRTGPMRVSTRANPKTPSAERSADAAMALGR